MPYKTPLRKPKVRESVFAHTVKLCWFYIKFEDIQDKITLKKFCDEFEKMVVIGGIWEKVLSEFEIDCDLHKEDGTLHKPNYKKLFGKKGWINLYDWKEQYPKFKADKLMSSEETEREKYIRYMAKLNQNDFNLLDRCYDKEEEYTTIEETGGKDMTYYRNKNNDTISNIDDRLRKRNGFDKTKLELDGKLKADVETETKTNVTVNEDVLKVLSDAITRRNNQSDS